jgi:hypothetical protein
MLFLVQFNINLNHPITMHPLRLNDDLIMEALISLDIEESELKICNQ